MEQLASAPPPDGSFGALLQAFRHRAYLSQEQLAARAELSERTVRNLEAGRVRSPRTTTVRLLADALELAEPERKSWLAAAREANRQPAEPGPPGAPAQVPGLVIVALLTGDAQNASAFAMACQIDKAAELVLVVRCGEGTQPDTSSSRTERAARQVSWWRGPAGPDSDPSHPILSHRTAG
jgi:transcriptional regulator with XRE-family HTH domain